MKRYARKEHIPWSATRFETFQFCPKLYYYQYVAKERIPMNYPMALGLKLHKHAERFRRPDGRVRYKSADAYANAFKANWKRFVINTGKIQGREIRLSSPDEPWQLMHIGMNICKTFYEKYSKEEPPLFVEVPFDFFLDGHHYVGRMDEIRHGGVIRDHKSGKHLPGQMELEYDPQFTLYVIAFGSLCHGDPNFAGICGINPEDAARWAGNPDFASNRITMEYHYMRTGEVFTTKRTNAHYAEFHDTVDDFEERISRGVFTPNRGRDNCDYCLANEYCNADTKTLYLPPEQKPQLALFDVPSATLRPKPRTLKLNFPRRRRKRSEQQQLIPNK